MWRNSWYQSQEFPDGETILEMHTTLTLKTDVKLTLLLVSFEQYFIKT